MAGRHPTLRLEVGQFSHPGRKRSNNEDWLGAFQPEDPERLLKKGSLFLVADGMGGHQSGEMASRRAVDHVIRTYMDDPTADVVLSLQRAIESANRALYTAADASRRRRWGTTLVVAVVRHDELWIANVGDSRAYLLRGGKLRQLSRDHSWAASVDADAPAGDWIGRHIITRALGLKPEVQADLFPPIKLQIGDRVLLCSDGLTTPLSDAKIQDIAVRYPAQEAAEQLVGAANAGGGPDNVSVILIQTTDPDKARQLRPRDSPRSPDQLPGELDQGPGGFWKPLTEPETWQRLIVALQQALPGGDLGFRSPVFLAIVLLIILALIGLGFVVGLVVFH